MSAGRIPTTANSPLTAKGDLFSFSTAPARLAVGSNGDTIVANSSTATGLSYAENYAAGKNKIINGDFGIWQRGTSYTQPSGAPFAYGGADRWLDARNGGGIVTISQQAFTPGVAPTTSSQGKFFYRYNQTVAGSGQTYSLVNQRIENVQTLAGQSVTFSFYAKADTTRTVTLALSQNFGFGGSSGIGTALGTFTLTTSFTRFTSTVTLPSLATRTIGADSYLELQINLPLNTTFTFDMWGVQVEAGSVATAFQTATGTIQGELAACQRYYYRVTADGVRALSGGLVYTTTNSLTQLPYPVTMRIRPTGLEQSGTASNYASMTSGTSLNNCTSVPAFDQGTTSSMAVIIGVASGLVVGNFTYLFGNSSAAFLGWSAEL